MATENAVVAYPNPVKNMVTVKLVSTQMAKTSVLIVDMSGRIVKNIPVQLNNGDQYLPVDMTGLQSGTYLIKTVLNNRVQQQLINKL